jgi:uncharacterized protein YdhG (YjbR/CyaY superfamily)
VAGKPTTPEEYLAGVPDQARAALDEVRGAIREALPDAEETISYSILGYRVGGRIICYCAGWARHVSLYPVPEGDEEYAASSAPFRTGRGTLRFPLSTPIPRELVIRTAQLMREAISRGDT